jgi:predicted dehydrogenase
MKGIDMKKVGIIGCGGIAHVHGWVLADMENAEIAALCDTDVTHAEKIAGAFAPGAAIVTDWESLLDADLDAVHICTPHVLHAPMATAFLEHGKAVFCEKPCAVNTEQFEALAAADRAHPGKLGICFQNRYNETTLLMDRLIADGRIGEVLGARGFVTWRRDADYYVAGPWRGKLETAGGGALINQSIHTLDLLLHYCGVPEQVKGSLATHHLPEQVKGAVATACLPDLEVEDTVEAWMSFPDGKRACFYASNGYAKDAPVLIEIQGQQGRICMNGQEVTLYRDGTAPEHFLCEQEQGIGKDYWGCGHKACIRDFYRALDSGERYRNDLQGTAATFRTMMEIYREGRRDCG